MQYVVFVFFFEVNDTLDDIFDASDEEEESQDIVNQVLDEIGIEISGKVWMVLLSSHISYPSFLFFFPKKEFILTSFILKSCSGSQVVM